jgi:hypothetical protein
MHILAEYTDDRSALEAAVKFVGSDPPLNVVEFETPVYGGFFIRLFKNAIDVIDGYRAVGCTIGIDTSPGDEDLYEEVVALARHILVGAYEAQQAGELS